jgi:hypothetical protein
MPLQKRKGMPRLKLKARITSKVMEKDLKAKAKMLMDDPELILPDCAADCGSCPFKKTRKALDKISKYKDDPVKLAKLSRRGDRLARAYAATIGIVHEEKMPYLATGTYPAGTIAYAQRGKTDKEKLIGVQNFDSPKWRVMSVLDLVHRRGLHFYSYGDNFVCTGREASPPDEYVKVAAESVGATRADGDKYSCPHNPESVNHIRFDWVTADQKILLCDQCAARAKNTLAKIGEGMAVHRVLNEFEISIVRPLRKVAGKSDCSDLLNKPIHDDLLQEYSNGKLGDKELIEKHLLETREELVKLDRRAFVRGDKCFGDDQDAFVKDMTEDSVEAKALAGLLSEVGHPVVADSGTSVNDLLKRYWSEHGRNALMALVPEATAEKYFNEDEDTDSPIKVIRRALRESEHEEISSRIPKYSCLSQYGEFVDKIVRAHKTGGQSSAVAVLDAEKSNDHRIRSISHSFYLALGVTTKSWKFTDEEKEYGKHLMSIAKRLLQSASEEEHHEVFTEYLREAGCTEEIKRA